MKKVRKLMLISVLALLFIIPTVVKANEVIFKSQFFCHVRYGKCNIPCNIEPARESINPLTCN